MLILSLQGDSGSPVYTVDPDGSANIVGIVSGAVYGMFVAVDAATPLPAGLRWGLSDVPQMYIVADIHSLKGCAR